MRRIDAPRDRSWAEWRLLASLGLLAFAAAPASSQNAVAFAPDITALLGTGPAAVVGDDDVGLDDASGGVTGFAIPPGTFPANVEVSGYDLLPTGNRLVSVDTTSALPGLPPGTPAEPNDVVEFAPATGLFSVYFDGAAAGVPAGARIDAVAVDAALVLLLSFDTSVALPGVGAVEDEDVVSYTAGVFGMVFDGSAAGIASGLDLDGVDWVGGPPSLLVSFDASGSVGGVTFDDEDALRYALGPGSWAMYFDASLSDPVDWPAADLVALPEPALLPGLAAGAALLAGCGRRRNRRSRSAHSRERPGSGNA